MIDLNNMVDVVIFIYIFRYYMFFQICDIISLSKNSGLRIQYNYQITNKILCTPHRPNGCSFEQMTMVL